MALAGPRLDRPSAVGEEGRPRATSLWVATLVAVVLSFAVTFVAWQASVVVALALPTGLVTAGAALLDRTDLPATFLGHICFFPAALALLAFVPVAFVATDAGFVALGLVCVMLGLSGTWADVARRETLRSAGIQTGQAYLVMAVLQFGLLTAAVGFGWVVALVVALVTSGGGHAPDVFRLVLVVTAVAAAFRFAVWALPVRQLWPRSGRDRAETVLDRVGFWLTVGVVAGAVAGGVVVALGASGVLSAAVARVPGLEVALGVTTSDPVVRALSAVGGLALLAGLLAVGVRTVTRQFDPRSTRWMGAVAAGAVFSVGMPFLVFAMVPVGGVAGFLLALAVTVFGPVALLLALGVLYFLLSVEVVPERAGGPALAAAGLVALAIGAAESGLAAPYVLASMAGAMLVWDLSTFGLGLTATLGHLPETRRLEVFHGLVSASVGAATVVTLSGLVVLFEFVSPGGAVLAATVAVLAAVVLAWPLRG